MTVIHFVAAVIVSVSLVTEAFPLFEANAVCDMCTSQLAWAGNLLTPDFISNITAALSNDCYQLKQFPGAFKKCSAMMSDIGTNSLSQVAKTLNSNTSTVLCQQLNLCPIATNQTLPLENFFVYVPLLDATANITTPSCDQCQEQIDWLRATFTQKAFIRNATLALTFLCNAVESQTAAIECQEIALRLYMGGLVYKDTLELTTSLELCQQQTLCEQTSTVSNVETSSPDPETAISILQEEVQRMLEMFKK